MLCPFQFLSELEKLGRRQPELLHRLFDLFLIKYAAVVVVSLHERADQFVLGHHARRGFHAVERYG